MEGLFSLLLLHELGRAIDDSICNADNDKKDDKRSNPLKGKPGSKSQTHDYKGDLKQERTYAPDGYPEEDIDYDHDHGYGKPHRHRWNRPNDGSAPTNKNRLSGEKI